MFSKKITYVFIVSIVYLLFGFFVKDVRAAFVCQSENVSSKSCYEMYGEAWCIDTTVYRNCTAVSGSTCRTTTAVNTSCIDMGDWCWMSSSTVYCSGNPCDDSCPTESGDGDLCGDYLGTNDCGDSCGYESNADDEWLPTGDTQCGGTRACGERWDTETEYYNDCESYNVWNVTSYNNCGACRECGPYYGTWGSCTYSGGNFERCRNVSYDCSANTTECEPCRGEIYGTFFDASQVNDCSNVAGQPKVGGVTVTATGQTNHSSSYSDNTASDGSYSINGTNLKVPEDYLMSFSGLDTALYESTPKLMCDFGVSDDPSTWQTSLSSKGETVRWRVGFWKVYGTWFQVQGGEVYAENGIESVLPGTCSLAANWESCGNVVSDAGSYTDQTPLVRQVFNTDGSRDNPGVAFVGSDDIDLGEADNAVISSEGWEAVSDYQGRDADYGHFNVVTGRVDRQEWGGSGKPSGSSTGIYTSSGNITIDSDWDLGGGGSDETIVVVHDGSVSITSNINVEKGSYLAVIASGSINVASNVTALEGVYVADSTIDIESTGDTSTDQQFIGEGTFIGWGGVSLNRDRGITNNTEPPHRFIFRQDFVVNAPDGMRSSRVTWREIRP